MVSFHIPFFSIYRKFEYANYIFTFLFKNMKVIIGLLSVKLSDKRIINQLNNARY